MNSKREFLHKSLHNLLEFANLPGKKVRSVGLHGNMIKTYVLEFEDGTMVRIGGVDVFLAVDKRRTTEDKEELLRIYRENLDRTIARLKENLEL